MFKSYSERERAEALNANSKGCEIPAGHPLPYTLQEMTKTSARNLGIPLHKFWFENGRVFYTESNSHEMPEVFWRVICGGLTGGGKEMAGVAMTGWFRDKQEARKVMENYNVRHFKCIGLSHDPLKPVLI